MSASGTLVSVNVGLPRDVAWQGRTVRTAVWKTPVGGRRMVRRLNIDGDGQGDLAGHGGEHRAVFVYQRASYEYWLRELGRSGFGDGAFGENFTVDGLADDAVCIGDRYRIGGALLEVSQPRVTCYRIGIRLDEPRIAALLVAHGRPGFYFRVIEEGEVGAGDAIMRVAEGAGGMSVAEVDALLYKPGHPADRLERALRLPALSPGWLASFRALLERPAAGNAGLAPASGPAPAWSGFRALRVAAKARESASVTSLVLEAADGSALPAALPGQFVALRLHPTPDAPALLRSYSLSGPPGEPRYRVSIKRNPGGVAGAYVQDGVRVGDAIEVGAPRGAFTLGAGEGPVILLSAGIGATPVLAMLHALAAARSPREVWWINGARDGAEQPFAAEVRACLAALPHAHRHIRYSAPRPEDRPTLDFDVPGRLGAAVLQGLADLPRDAEAYLCGPTAFMTDLTAALVATGLAANRIHSEAFAAGPGFTPGIAAAPPKPPHAPAGEAGPGPAISFARSGLTVQWAPRYQNLLELAEACDVPVRWSCRAGVCHNCETPLIAGTIAYAPDPVDAPAPGNLLLCCAQPREDLTLDL